MTGLTRRAALVSAGAAVAVAGVPGAVQGEDAILQRRYAEWEAAYQSFGHVLDELAASELKAWAAAKERGIERGTEDCEAIEREFGVDTAHDNEASASAEEQKAYERFLNTSTGSPQGLLLKVKAAQKNEDSAASTTLVEALSRDFERLIEGMRS